MDKSLMTMGKIPDDKLSHPYIEGVNAFINSVRAVVDLSGNIPCPCIHCVNCYRQSPQTVHIHLLHRGMIVFSQTAQPTGGRQNDGDLFRALLDTAHWYLLYNSPELEPYLKYVISYAYIV